MLQNHVGTVVGVKLHVEIQPKIGAAETTDGTGEIDIQGRDRNQETGASNIEDHARVHIHLDPASDMPIGLARVRETEKRDANEGAPVQYLQAAVTPRTIGNAGRRREKANEKRVENEEKRKNERKRKRRKRHHPSSVRHI
jgi:hypothetical protein